MKHVILSKGARFVLGALVGSVLALSTDGCGHDDVPAADACSPRCGECGAPDGCGGTCCDESKVPGDTESCQPLCDGTRCDDGCGGSCACQDGTVCRSDGLCVPESECVDTCESLGASCGEVCGRACGTCDAGQVCAGGQCVGTQTCADCPLNLSVITDTRTRRVGDELVIGVDLTPHAAASLPRMAELRVLIDGPAALVDAQSGSALTDAGKALYRDPFTGQAFKQAADGAYRFLVYGSSRASEIGAGRLAELRLRITGDEPIALRLQRREQTFAPAGADALLQTTSYDLPLVVKP